MNDRELRVATEVRLEQRQEGEARRIVGYAALFDTEVDIAGMFREQVRRGAFAGSIQNGDVRALVDHNPSLILGRSTADTLSLSEDNRGLRVEIDPPDTQIARDIMVSIERGDVSGMSIGFRARRQEWDDTEDPPLRTILDVELLDVSVVTFPANPETDVALRSLEGIRHQAQREHNFRETQRRKMRRAIMQRDLDRACGRENG